MVAHLSGSNIEIHPLDASRIPDAESVMHGCGDAARCWCAYWTLPNAAFKANYRAGPDNPNRDDFLARADTAPAIGLVAYVDGAPAGWCRLGPRDSFDRLNRSATFKPADPAQGWWSITCFVVHKSFRRRGLMHALLAAAVRNARENGARGVEGYPVDPERRGTRPGSGDLYVGTRQAFLAAGFAEADRPTPARCVMRILF